MKIKLAAFAYPALFLILGLSVTLFVSRQTASGSTAILKTASAAQSAQACQPLPPPSGTIVNVSTVNELQNAVNNVTSGDTILVADGVYNLNGVYLRIDTPNVTLRSASGSRDSVVLDGNYVTTEIIQIVASDVTVADVTLREAYYHPIHVMTTNSGDTLNTIIYNVHIIDPGEQAIKINPGSDGYYPDNGEIACSHIELTDAGRPHVNPTAGGCYTGGIDAHQAQGWVIRDNLIEGFWCDNGLSEHGIHLWRGCRDTLVERNVLNNNARGIGFGLTTSGPGRTYPDNPCPNAGSDYVDDYGGIIRNNFIFANQNALFSSEYGFDCGICLAQSCGTQVFHNTVASTQAPFSSIEWRFEHTEAEIKNNLVSHNLRDRGGTAVLDHNLEGQPLSLFVDGANGDLHLAGTAVTVIDQAVALAGVNDDVDGDGRPIGAAPDIGADEYTSTNELNLHVIPADQAVHLAWNVSGTLPLTSTWQIDYYNQDNHPFPITDIIISTHAYTLAGLTNYTPYTVTLNAMLDGSPILTDTVTVMPTDIAVYLPVVSNKFGATLSKQSAAVSILTIRFSSSKPRLFLIGIGSRSMHGGWITTRPASHLVNYPLVNLPTSSPSHLYKSSALFHYHHS